MVHLRPATASDAELIHALIVELATYEREPDAVEATPDTLRTQLAADPPPFECLLVAPAPDQEPVGMALFFHNYSTWRGKRGVYLEDLFVRPSARGQGFGLALLRALAQLARERDCPRLDWAVLDWNEPAIEFYRRLGAEPLREWTTFRLSGEALARLACGD
ncbi:MAG TPA: GNAT family N-acetyltransferase [Planctomycetes bacterium]|nr:GNAT family N-acetyltransferase [Planctomycetota bacterium]